jgi:hypothetical protein
MSSFIVNMVMVICVGMSHTMRMLHVPLPLSYTPGHQKQKQYRRPYYYRSYQFPVSRVRTEMY